MAPSDRPAPAAVALATGLGMLSTYFVARLAYRLVAGGARRRSFA
jgi:xanthosine utilization system XapX-like protein